MLVDTSPTAVRVVRNRSFSGLMVLYESNHIRLHQLLGDLVHVPNGRVSRVGSDMDLHLMVLERCRYTTTLNLTYLFDHPDPETPDPDLAVRIYHDARLAEALSCRREHAHKALGAVRPTPRGELDRRWSMNIMLNKWLEFCIDHDHFADLRPAALR